MVNSYSLLTQVNTSAKEDLKSSIPQRSRRTRFGLFGLIVLCVLLPVLYKRIGQAAEPSFELGEFGHDSEALKLEQCPSAEPPAAIPPAPSNLWAPLSPVEIKQIDAWLHDSRRGLNLTSGLEADISDNMVFLIEAYPPSKASALAYLADPSGTAPPSRYARVTIHHGSAKTPSIKDYLVGPLHTNGRALGGNAHMRELTEIYHRDIPYNARGFANAPEFAEFLKSYIVDLRDVMEDLFGASATGSVNDTLTAGTSAPFGFDGSFRRMWVTWRRNAPGAWLHPVNFFQYVDITGTDRATWKILKVVYNHQVFPSLDEFLNAYHNGTLRRLPSRPDQTTDLSWSSRTRPKDAPQRDLDDRPGPRSVSFAGLRFRVDRAQQWIGWMGWGLYLGFERDMGLSLWDVRLRGERILYQLAPQEAIAQYAGNDPGQTTTAWLDRFFGMGSMVRDMLPGYDCPHEAVFLPATTHRSGETYHRERAICVFEHDTGRPLTRHTGWMRGEFGAVKGYTLVIRSISTVGNYDYLFDYILHLDGTIEVRLSASGYLQGGFWEESQEGYGTAIRETTMGSLHDHVINYKVDLDIAGTSNSLLHTSTSQEEITQPWFDEDWGQTVIQQKISRQYIDNEDDALLKYPTNFQGGYALVNREQTNKWGIPRGYSIHPGFSPIHNTVVGSKRLLHNANWARYNLAVSRRKDTEPSASSMWNLHLPGKPVVDFHKFFDGENITQEDLVAWVNIGMHHLPQAEDAPNTRTNTATSSFFLTPLNYFDFDIALDSTNAIMLDPEDGFKHDDYGVSPVHCIPAPPEPFTYEPQSLDSSGHVRSLETQRQAAEMYHRIRIPS